MFALIRVATPTDPDTADLSHIVPVSRIIGISVGAGMLLSFPPEMDDCTPQEGESDVRLFVARIGDAIPDGAYLWDWATLHTSANPERVALEMFAGLSQEERDGCASDARFHLDGVREPVEWDSVAVWIESGDTRDSYIVFQSLLAEGLLVVPRRDADGTTSEYLCHIVGQI